MKRILLSLLVVGAVGGTAFFATNAFFSDTETSTANTFTAGSVDLRIGNDSYKNDPVTGLIVASPGTTWALKDLVVERYFDFADVKPGDVGEDTITLNVNNNPVWACAKLTLTSNMDNSCVEPELADDAACGTGDVNWNGDLAQGIYFVWWNDDGDNVLETDEEATKYYLGPASISTLMGPDNVLDLTLADSQLNFFNPAGPATPLLGNTDYHIGKGWCFGDMVLTPEDEGDGSPITRGTGFGCNPFMVDNSAQTDSLTADVEFSVVQSRNNTDYLCPEHALQNRTVVVNSNSMNGWFGYNDETDVVDNNLVSFVLGPSTPPSGLGSAQMTVSGSQRRNIATQLLQGTKLSDIDNLKFSTFQTSPQLGSERAIYLHFNVSFDGLDTWQRRLVFVPGVNGSVVNDSWQEWDATSGLWTWSGFAANGNKWPIDNNTNEYRTWADLVSAYPNIKMLGGGLGWFGLRAGEPYADGFTGSTDKVVVGISGSTTTYDFEQ